MSRFRMMTINLTLLNFFYDGAEAIKHAFSISFWGKITLHTNTNVIKLKTWCYRAFRYNSWSDFGWVLEIENRNVQSHSMAKSNLNKTEKIKTKTTTAWKLITSGIIINKNKNPLFRTSLHKSSKNCFLWSKSWFTTFTFRGTF